MAEQITVMGSRLELASARHLPKFLIGTMRINRQLRRTPGNIDSKLRAEFRKLTFWTLSTWDDEASLHTFARSDPHASVIGDLRRSGSMRSANFAFWTIDRGDALPAWDEVVARIGAAVNR